MHAFKRPTAGYKATLLHEITQKLHSKKISTKFIRVSTLLLSMSPRLPDTLAAAGKGLVTMLDALGTATTILTGRYTVGGAAMRSARGGSRWYQRMGYAVGALSGIALNVMYYPSVLIAGVATNVLMAAASKYAPAKTPLLDPI